MLERLENTHYPIFGLKSPNTFRQYSELTGMGWVWTNLFRVPSESLATTASRSCNTARASINSVWVRGWCFIVATFYRPQRSWGKVMFSQASVILLTGRCLPHLLIRPPQSDPPEQTPLEQTPPSEQTPPWSRHPPEQTPPDQTPPGSRHPPR